MPNTKECDSETGDCVCSNGWNGTDCRDDIDECLDGGRCQENSFCVNTIGSFDCLCDIGYELMNGNFCRGTRNIQYNLKIANKK